MLVCGPHIIRPDAVTTLKQVRSQTDPDKLLFLVLGYGIDNDNIFLTEVQVAPLLKYWGIAMDDIKSLTPRPANAPVSYFRKARPRRSRVAKEDHHG